MQYVSQAWLENQRKTMVGESFVEVSFDITDPEAVADATASENGSAYISNVGDIINDNSKTVVDYVSLEQNMWLLDGSRETIPVSNDHLAGYVSDVLSDENGTFIGNSPTITVKFTRVHTNPIPALTIKWGTAYNEYAEEFIITAYHGSSITASKTVTGNKEIQNVVMMDIDEYDRITLTILKWCLPKHRARVDELFLGMNKVYTKSDLLSYSHSQKADLLARELPKFEISFSVSNIDGTYDLYNTKGLSRYLIPRQEIKTRYGYKIDAKNIEWIKGGTFYLTDWNLSQNGTVAEFKARDVFELLSATYYEGQYSETGTSLFDLLMEIMEKSNIPKDENGEHKLEWTVWLEDFLTTAPLPVDTFANCLQLIANAGLCSLYVDREGKIRVSADWMNDEVLYKITPWNSYSKPSIKLDKPVAAVNAPLHQYFEDDKTSELYKGEVVCDGTTEIWIVYSNPARNVAASVTGGTLDSAEYYTNACKLTITGSGMVAVTLVGTILKVSKSDVVPLSSRQGEVLTLENPLLTDRDLAANVGELTKELSQLNSTMTIDWRADPILDVFDLVTVETEFGTKEVILTSVNYTYNGAFRGKFEGMVLS